MAIPRTTRGSTCVLLLVFVLAIYFVAIKFNKFGKNYGATTLVRRNRPPLIPDAEAPEYTSKGKRPITSCKTGEILWETATPQGSPIQELSGQVVAKKNNETDVHRIRSFSLVFARKGWGGGPEDGELHASGPGSTVNRTLEQMISLHSVILELKEKLNKSRISILDVPCGDMAWMHRFLENRDDIEYTGMDIVPALIQHHQKRFKKHPWKFIQQDIVAKPLEKSYDLIHNRHMLFHLVDRDILKALKHLSDSGSSYLITSSHGTTNFNSDLNSNGPLARFRLLNLELPPYTLVPPLCYWRDAGEVLSLLYKLPLRRFDKCGEKAKQRKVRLSNIDFTLITCDA